MFHVVVLSLLRLIKKNERKRFIFRFKRLTKVRRGGNRHFGTVYLFIPVYHCVSMGNEIPSTYQRPPPNAFQQHVTQLQQAHPVAGGRESFERRKYLAQNRLRQNYYREYGSSVTVASAAAAAIHHHSYNRKVLGSISTTSSPRRSYNSHSPRRVTTTPSNHSTKADFDSPASAILAFASTKTHKGLTNNSGENNCFLNATIQALWHVGPFRVELQDFLAAHAYLIANDGNNQPAVHNHSTTDAHHPASSPTPPPPPHDDSLLRALGNIFYQMEYGTEAVVSPDELRRVIGQHESGSFVDSTYG